MRSYNGQSDACSVKSRATMDIICKNNPCKKEAQSIGGVMNFFFTPESPHLTLIDVIGKKQSEFNVM